MIFHICEKRAVLAHKMKKEMCSKVNETPTVDADSVYNNNKCFKMKHYKKDENFICKKCVNGATPEDEQQQI
jgi:hypothetical protein